MSEKTPAPQNRLLVLCKLLLNVLRHNWRFKLVALLVSVGLWALLSTQDVTLTRTKVFTDVTVSTANPESVKRNGFIVTSDLNELPHISLTAEVPQGRYDAASYSDFNPRIDLSRINESGEIEVRITTTSTSAYGTVTSVEPETLPLTVEPYVIRYRIPVVVTATGDAPEGYYVSGTISDPPLFAVSGPQSQVNRVVRAEVTMDLSTLAPKAGVLRTAVPFKLVDSNGEEIENSLIQVTNESVPLDTVVVEQTLYPQRELPLSAVGLVVGDPAPGYEIKSVTFSPEVVTAAGNESALRVLEDVFADGAVDVTGMTDSVNRQLRLRRPSELVYMSPDTLTVAVEIGPIITEHTFSDVKLGVVGTDSKHAYSYSVKRANVTLTGEKLWLDTVKAGHVSLKADVTGLEEGTYMLPIRCTVEGDNGQQYEVAVDPAEIEITVKKR